MMIEAILAELSIPPDFEFRMNQATWDELLAMCGSTLPYASAYTMYGVRIKIWAWVPDGEVWRVSRELLKDLEESS